MKHKTSAFVFTLAVLGGFILAGNFGCQTQGRMSAGDAPPGKTGELENVPFAELEEVLGKSALEWVEERNRESEARLGTDATFRELKTDILKIIQAKDRIPSISIRGTGTAAVVYNFWQDEKNPKGIYRSQSLGDYRRKLDNWQTLIDVDAIALAEKEPWVFKGLVCAPVNEDDCLLLLSRGGGDAVVAREYDLTAKSFVKDGISFPEAKMTLSWRDDNSLWVSAPHGPGTVSTSGYPITVRLWRRGEDLAIAPVLFKGQVVDVSVSAGTYRSFSGGTEQTIDLISRSTSFFQNEVYVGITGGAWRQLPVPLESELLGLSQGMMLFTVKKDATVFGSQVKTGALYAFDIASWRENSGATGPAPKPIIVEKVFEPSATQAFSGVSMTRDLAMVSYLEDVRGRLSEVRRTAPTKSGNAGTWAMKAISLPGNKGVVSSGFSSYREVLYTVFYSDFLTPSQMHLGGEGAALVNLRQTPARFDSTGMKVETFHAVSKDGTKVPYFLVSPKNMDRTSGKTPTVIYAYGGFEIPSTPNYLSALGKVWVERGGAYVLANIRGGGEYGPKWHQAALREKRQNAFDDLFAVAESVIKKGFTSSNHLGVRGGSNGGLLAGVALTQRPDLFAAILCQVPLLDMLRYHKLLAGASWMEEYGNPDVPAERAALAKYSPFQNVKAGVKYPEPFFTTSTRDDRVHPGHARRMVARMRELGHPVLYYENIEGGHAGAATLDSRAALSAREYRYLWDKLK